MTLPSTPQPNCPMKPPTAAKTTSTQLFGVLYITLMGMIDSMVPNSGPWSLLGKSVSNIIKLAPILWWALPTGPAVPHPEPPNASSYAWLPERYHRIILILGAPPPPPPPPPCKFLYSVWIQDMHFSDIPIALSKDKRYCYIIMPPVFFISRKIIYVGLADVILDYVLNDIYVILDEPFLYEP
ncbi:hypothetical protein DSO57_1017280 [Entomophthora muscae]|uniref:Uncharacterized protein n=1 Tax=Entomophthora muscae TaxID=34485 RepID=A0ACC2UQJ5_9FUNG|nr:hypothetical protein DSO57_1017280 [Entomophthora muscae]